MDRREFFSLMAMATVGAKLGKASWALASSGYGYGGSTAFKSSYLVNYFLVQYMPEKYLAFYNIDNEKIVKVPVDFDPHAITRISEDIVVCAEKYGPNIITVDIKKGRIIASHTYTEQDHMEYMGHCLYDPSRNAILTTEQRVLHEAHHDRHKGVVSVRDPLTLKVLQTFDSYGFSPHDLIYTANGDIAICNTSGGELSFSNSQTFWQPENRNVAIVSPNDFSLIKRIEMPNRYLAPGHIKLHKDTLVVSGIYSYMNDVDFLWDHVNWNPIVVDKNGKATEFIQGSYVAEVMDSEFLSTAVHEEFEIVAMTIPGKNTVNIWSLKDQSFLAHINLPLPKGIHVHPRTKDFMVATAIGYHSINPVSLKVTYLGLKDVGNGLSHSYII
jgi:hypothetical protein